MGKAIRDFFVVRVDTSANVAKTAARPEIVAFPYLMASPVLLYIMVQPRKKKIYTCMWVIKKSRLNVMQLSHQI